ncbi:hypothetical Protein YC6258_03716 [Gynuella sunshinyii YC6258]|uniref:Uncharacterized protein n=1 Tax=Gynuella sunshinyii YC6258 TaxID=1445510 RepID=A0A0C5VM36_9GAMM|nr:hypothetical Protein YC6258_03716 [Gynuella sunshinyii YC6258]
MLIRYYLTEQKNRMNQVYYRTKLYTSCSKANKNIVLADLKA